MQMIYFTDVKEGRNGDNHGRLLPTMSGLWWTGVRLHQQEAQGESPSQSKSLKSSEEHKGDQFTVHSGCLKDPTPEVGDRPTFALQPAIYARHPNMDPCHGIFSAYGPYFPGGVMLPLNPSASEGLVVYVNPKQYPAIIRRRESRAKAEQEKRFQRGRKPYMHESRHLHAKRRPRGCGGRFLNTKSSNNSSVEIEKNKSFQQHHSSSQSSESMTLDPSRRETDSRASLSGFNEVMSMCSGRDTAPGGTHWPFHLPGNSNRKF